MKKSFSSLISSVLIGIAALSAVVITPAVQALPVTWQPLPLETQAAYGYTHKATLDATNCVGLSSNVAANIFPVLSASTTTPGGKRLTSAAVRVVTAFSGNGMTGMTLKLGNTTVPGQLLTTGIGTNITADTWAINTNTLPLVMNAATNLVVTLVPASDAGNGLLTNLTAGRIEIFIGLQNLTKLNGN